MFKFNLSQLSGCASVSKRLLIINSFLFLIVIQTFQFCCGCWPSEISSLNLKAWSHSLLHISRVNNRICLLFLWRGINWEKLHRHFMPRITEQQKQRHFDSMILFHCPDTDVRMTVSDGDWLYWQSRLKSSSTKPGQSLTIGRGSLSKYKYLRPRQWWDCPLNYTFCCLVSTLRIFPE